jgi:hypothetical protein
MLATQAQEPIGAARREPAPAGSTPPLNTAVRFAPSNQIRQENLLKENGKHLCEDRDTTT